MPGCTLTAVSRARVVVTGSAGHLGEALVRVVRDRGDDVTGVDIRRSPGTTVVGSVADRAVVRECVAGAGAVIHSATLHKPHVGSHSKQAFIDTNLSGTLILLEEAVAAGVGSFVFTSTTSTFGRALTPAEGEPAAWLTEEVVPRPRNIYGVTKKAAEDLCELAHAEHGPPVIVLRTSRFFPRARRRRRDARDPTATRTLRPTSTCTGGPTWLTWPTRTCWRWTGRRR